MSLTKAQKTALKAVSEAKKVWRHTIDVFGYWQVDRTGGCVTSGGELNPRTIENLVIQGFLEVVDGEERKHNALARDQWIDYGFFKVVLTDKGEAYLAGVLLT